MPIFRLDPIEWAARHPTWKATFHHEACWVRASFGDEARDRVSTATMQARDAHPGQPLRRSPWQDPALTKCCEDRPAFPVRGDAVVGPNGRIVGTPIMRLPPVGPLGGLRRS